MTNLAITSEKLVGNVPAAATASGSPASKVPFGLTARESEVLKLVARGLTDSAVAEQLFISPRTVSQHLRPVYGKLRRLEPFRSDTCGEWSRKSPESTPALHYCVELRKPIVCTPPCTDRPIEVILAM